MLADPTNDILRETMKYMNEDLDEEELSDDEDLDEEELSEDEMDRIIERSREGWCERKSKYRF